MIKKLKVDVAASLGFQENSRLKPADKSEYANKHTKLFVCTNCGNEIEVGDIYFGEDAVLCPKCKIKMTRK